MYALEVVRARRPSQEVWHFTNGQFTGITSAVPCLACLGVFDRRWAIPTKHFSVQSITAAAGVRG